MMAASVVLLPPAGRPRHEHQAALFRGDLLEHPRQSELVDRLDARRNDAQHEADRAALLEDVAAESPEAVDAVREIDVLVILKALDLLGAEQRLRYRLRIVAIEPLFLGRDDERPVDAHHRITADFQVQVGRAARHGRLQQLIDLHGLRRGRSGRPRRPPGGVRPRRRTRASRACLRCVR
jgi:hypothetical protein